MFILSSSVFNFSGSSTSTSKRNTLLYPKPVGNVPSAVLEPSVLWGRVQATSKLQKTNPDINEMQICILWFKNSTDHMFWITIASPGRLATVTRINSCDSSHMKGEAAVGSHFLALSSWGSSYSLQRIVNTARSPGCNCKKALWALSSAWASVILLQKNFQEKVYWT